MTTYYQKVLLKRSNSCLRTKLLLSLEDSSASCGMQQKLVTFLFYLESWLPQYVHVQIGRSVHNDPCFALEYCWIAQGCIQYFYHFLVTIGHTQNFCTSVRIICRSLLLQKSFLAKKCLNYFIEKLQNLNFGFTPIELLKMVSISLYQFKCNSNLKRSQKILHTFRIYTFFGG